MTALTVAKEGDENIFHFHCHHIFFQLDIDWKQWIFWLHDKKCEAEAYSIPYFITQVSFKYDIAATGSLLRDKGG